MFDFDAIVTGGGIVGASAALCLARGGHRILLVDSRVPEPPACRDGFDVRTVALSPGSINLLRSLGALEDVRRAPINRIVVSESEGTATIDFDANEIGAETLAEVVETKVLVERLWTILADRVELRAPSTVNAVEHFRDRVELVIDKNAVSAACLVVAEGRRSATLQQLGISVQDYKNNARAIGTVVSTHKPHNGCALQHLSLIHI